MSTAAGLRATSRLLADTLRAGLSADPALGPLFGGGGHVVSLRTPREMRTGVPPEVGLSVWLYHVERNGSLTGQPRDRLSDTELRRPALPITLHYLVTPLSNNGENEQLILGAALQILNDHSVLPVDPARPDLDDALRVHLEPLDLEATSRVWAALDSSYELCVSYLVEPVTITSGEPPDGIDPVLEYILDATAIASVGPGR